MNSIDVVMEALKGCAEVRYQSNLYGVRCEKCLATVAAFDTKTEAIEAWIPLPEPWGGE